ncbi:MAG: hypothetical protein HKO13_08315 [Sphingomonas sp.]|nr:hypothetical protein [Sphingomonas sp.]RZV51214.1 MAG: hypothetical protein EX258_04100 [Sphingomonadaceae bacterium]
MEELISLYWPVILVALVIGLIVGYLAFRPKQRISLSDDTPQRPHMQSRSADGGEGNTIVDAAAAGTADIAGQLLDADVHEHLPGADGDPDDLTALKGIGPKLASTLNGLGLTTYGQIAMLSDNQLEAIDEKLGAFAGRLKRDRVVEQAAYLARGDTAGYEARFGKL